MKTCERRISYGFRGFQVSNLISISQSKAKVAVVEDDPSIRRELREMLEYENFEVFTCDSGACVARLSRSDDIDIFLVDIGLPDISGLELVQFLKANTHAGVLIVSGRSNETDKVVGLQLGADDYVTKPYNARELTARIHSVLRRTKYHESQSQQTKVSSVSKNSLTFAEITLDAKKRVLVNTSIGEAELTTAEFETLYLFASNPDVVFSRDDLISSLKGKEWAGYDRAIDGLVSRIRKKLKIFDKEKVFIRTVHGTGYMFISHD